GSLLRGRVFARGFPQLLRRLGNIQDVIHNLKRQPDSHAEFAEPDDLTIFRAGIQSAADQAGGNQSGGFWGGEVFPPSRRRGGAFPRWGGALIPTSPLHPSAVAHEHLLTTD